jgi:hypothetical protein
LFQSLLRSSRRDGVNADEEKQAIYKNRGDHRHHAIDAVAVALTGPELLPKVAQEAARTEEYHARTGKWPDRIPIPPPWGTVGEFRRQVLSRLFEVFDKTDAVGHKAAGTEQGNVLVVSHRAVKRKLTGHLHKEDLWGAVDEREGIYRIRCQVAELTAKMLRPPVPESDQDARKRLFELLKKRGVSDKQARKQAKDLVEKSQFKRELVDPPLGKGGLVRDWALRRIIRDSLKANGLDPNEFSKKQISELAKAGKVRMPSGVPIKSVVTIGPIADPVKIAVKDPFTGKQAVNPRTGQPLYRFHISRNNHHIEIREDPASGEWRSKVVTMFEAAQRVRPLSIAGRGAQPAVDRCDREGKRFVMSLSEGETIYMKPDESSEPDYFVVFKLDREPDKIHFIHHWDARASQSKEGEPTREDIAVPTSKLKELGPEPSQPPYKVRVDALGNIRRMDD